MSAVTRLSRLSLVLVIASSVSGTFPVPYPEFDAVPSFGPHLIYSSGINGRADLAGFSYFTRNFDGGASDVVFFTGPNSDANMENEVATMKDILGSLPAGLMETKTDEKDEKDAKTDFEDAAKIAPLVPDESKETSTSENKEETSSTTPNPDEQETKEVDDIPQFLPGKSIPFDLPYPVFRLSGSAAYYPQLSTPFSSGFGGYEPTDYFRAQYDPFYDRFNSYQNLYHPFYSALDGNNFYSSIYPAIDRSPLFTPPTSVDHLIPGASPTQKPSKKLPPVTIDTVDRRFKEDDSKAERSNAASEKVSDQSQSEKKIESSTPAEPVTEKTAASATTTESSETSTHGAEDVKESTTVVDAAAVP